MLVTVGGYNELTIIHLLIFDLIFISFFIGAIIHVLSQQQDGCYSRIDFIIVHSCTSSQVVPCVICSAAAKVAFYGLYSCYGNQIYMYPSMCST